MKVKQIVASNMDEVKKASAELKGFSPSLIMLFGSKALVESDHVKNLHSEVGVPVVGCSTAGEISGDGVFDDTVVMSAIKFESAVELYFPMAKVGNDGGKNAGVELGQHLAGKNMKLAFVMGQGIGINGSALVEGMKSKCDKSTLITGGLAGDGGEFKETSVIFNGEVFHDSVICVGIAGEKIDAFFGTQGGWQTFGPIRTITKAQDNILYEIDGERALDVYKKYLGPKASELPASGLLYPFAIMKDNDQESGLIRTILAVDEEAGSLHFAGDIPTGGRLRLMHTDNKGLAQGASEAASSAADSYGRDPNVFALLVSCVGRKIVMGTDIDDEVDAVKAELGDNVVVTGFYSYGELAPYNTRDNCQLHNQTMTITCIKEAA